MNNNLPPCLIIAFSRPDGVSRLIESAASAGVTKIYLAIDGQKSENIEMRRSFSILIEKSKTNVNLEIVAWFREENLGTQISVITALDWFFSKEKSGIILEDDLLPSTYFFTFAASGLKHFETDQSVWLISGNQYFCENELIGRNHWATYPLIWGWATWADKWISMREEMLKGKIRWRSGVRRASIGFWTAGYRRANYGEVESWAILLAAQMHALGRYCLLPGQNLVTNNGFDDVAIHTREARWPMNVPVSDEWTENKFEKDEINEIANVIDRKIEDSIYGIQRKHQFLPLAEKFKIMKMIRKPNKSSVSERISRIRIPT